jgi:hypothetical protein
MKGLREIVDGNEVAALRAQTVELKTGHLLTVHYTDSEFEVWLSTEVDAFDGLCIGDGVTRDTAVANAVKVLEAALEELQNPPARI